MSEPMEGPCWSSRGLKGPRATADPKPERREEDCALKGSLSLHPAPGTPALGWHGLCAPQANAAAPAVPLRTRGLLRGPPCRARPQLLARPPLMKTRRHPGCRVTPTGARVGAQDGGQVVSRPRSGAAPATALPGWGSRPLARRLTCRVVPESHRSLGLPVSCQGAPGAEQASPGASSAPAGRAGAAWTQAEGLRWASRWRPVL